MLIACERCKRHFSMREESCPFCRHKGPLARVGAAALSAGVLLSGCDAGKEKQEPVAPEKKPFATVRGVVTDKDGKPLQGASVTLGEVETAPGRGFTKMLPTDATGSFDLGIIEPGSYMLSTTYAGARPQMDMEGYDQRPLNIAAGQELDLQITLELRMRTIEAPPYGAPPARRRIV
jgi:hypothetical protein